MEDRFTVGAEDHEVTVLGAFDAATHHVVEHHRGGVDLLDLLLQVIVEDRRAGALEAEPPGAVLFVGATLGGELLELSLVELGALRLEVRAKGAADLGTLVPIHPQPAHGIQDHLEESLGVALLVRVFDTQDELAARVAGVEPVEQGRAGASDVEETGGTRGEADADLGHEKTWVPAGKPRRSDKPAFGRRNPSGGRGKWPTEHRFACGIPQERWKPAIPPNLQP